MNPHDGKDTELQRDIEDIRDRYAPTSKETPPEMVDHAVMNMARRAVESDDSSRSSRWSLFTGLSTGPRWIGGVATAAVVVLAVTVFYEQNKFSPELEVAPLFENNAMLDELKEKDAVTGELRSSGLDDKPVTRDMQSQQVSQDGDLARSFEDSETAGVAGARANAPARNEEAQLRSDTPAPAQEPKPRSQTEYFREGEEVSAPEQAELGAAASTVLPSLSAEDADEEIASDLSDFRLRKMEQAKTDGAYRNDPQAWIERLVELHESGSVEELGREIEAFRKQYPDISLPESLDAYDPTRK